MTKPLQPWLPGQALTRFFRTLGLRGYDVDLALHPKLDFSMALFRISCLALQSYVFAWWPEHAFYTFVFTLSQLPSGKAHEV